MADPAEAPRSIPAAIQAVCEAHGLNWRDVANAIVRRRGRNGVRDTPEVQLRDVEVDRARLQQENEQLREQRIARMHEQADVVCHRLAAVEHGEHNAGQYDTFNSQAWMKRALDAETELTTLRQALRQLAQQWEDEASLGFSIHAENIRRRCADELLARLRERST